MRIVVVGAGVIGLTVAVRLAESGHDVHVFARDLPLETTSALAAALWYPYRIWPLDRARNWSTRSLEVFTSLADSAPDSGVTMRHGTELHREAAPDPWWLPAIPSLTRLPEPPAPYVDGWSFVAPVIEMPLYLMWLRGRLADAGGTVTRMALRALPDGADVVVNCSGLGARGLAADLAVEPVSGQVVRLAQVGLREWLLDGSGLTYVIPRSDDIVVGGTDLEGEWSRRPDPETADAILARATALVPQLRDARVLGHAVGLRPGRPAVRLECERQGGGGLIVHCYGHGGAGVTASWGCADDVSALIESECGLV